MSQSLSGTDWYMESFGLTVSFSLYGDLLGTSAWARREQAKCVKNGICKPTDPVEDSELAVAKKVKVEEPKKAPEEDMNSLNNEVNAPTEEELNFENDADESQEDPDDDFEDRRALKDVADKHVNGNHDEYENEGDFEEVDDTVNDF